MPCQLQGERTANVAAREEASAGGRDEPARTDPPREPSKAQITTCMRSGARHSSGAQASRGERAASERGRDEGKARSREPPRECHARCARGGRPAFLPGEPGVVPTALARVGHNFIRLEAAGKREKRRSKGLSSARLAKAGPERMRATVVRPALPGLRAANCEGTMDMDSTQRDG